MYAHIYVYTHTHTNTTREFSEYTTSKTKYLSIGKSEWRKEIYTKSTLMVSISQWTKQKNIWAEKDVAVEEIVCNRQRNGAHQLNIGPMLKSKVDEEEEEKP